MYTQKDYDLQLSYLLADLLSKHCWRAYQFNCSTLVMHDTYEAQSAIYSQLQLNSQSVQVQTIHNKIEKHTKLLTGNNSTH